MGKTRLRAAPEKRSAESENGPARVNRHNCLSSVAGRALQLQAAAGNRALQRLVQRDSEDVPVSEDLFNVPGVKLPPPGGGRSLPGDVRQDMEQSFGHSFSDVRVHEDSAPRSVGAVAYTQGTDIHFAPGRYRPDSESGRSLIGHELTHVVQQKSGMVTAPQGAGAPVNASPELEDEAAIVGESAARGMRVSVSGSGSGLQRAVSVPVQRVGGDDDPGYEADDEREEMAPEEAEDFLEAMPEAQVEQAIEEITVEELQEHDLIPGGAEVADGAQAEPAAAEPEAQAEAAPADGAPARRPGRARRAANAVRGGSGRAAAAVKQKRDRLAADRELGELEVTDAFGAAGSTVSAGKTFAGTGEEVAGAVGGAGSVAIGDLLPSGGLTGGTQEALTDAKDALLGSEPLEAPTDDFGAGLEIAGVVGGTLDAIGGAGQLIAGRRQKRDEGGVDNRVEGNARIAKGTSAMVKGAARAGASGALLAGDTAAAAGLATTGAVGQVAEGAVDTVRGTVGAGVHQYRKRQLGKVAKRATEAGDADVAEAAKYGANIQRKKRNRRLAQAGLGAMKLTGGALLLALGVSNPIGWAVTGAAGVLTARLAYKRWKKGKQKDEATGKTAKEIKREEREKYAKLWFDDQDKYKDVLSAYGLPDAQIGQLEYKTIYKALLNRNWG